jgi:hypothetical protein
MNKKISIFLSVLILVVLFSIFLTRSSNAQDQLQIVNLDCLAEDPASLKKCADEVNKGNRTIITITKDIVCTSRQDCEINLENVKGDILIQGLHNKNAGIKRQGNFDYFLFNIFNSSGFRIQELYFSDEGDGCEGNDPNNCKGFISLQSSQNIEMGYLKFYDSRNIAIKIQDSQSIGIHNSYFGNSGMHALDVNKSGHVLIEKNSIENSGSNGIIFFGVSNEERQSIISENAFNSNHINGKFAPCSSPCVPSQIKVKSGTQNLVIKRNTIKNGRMDEFDSYGIYTTGLELEGDLTNITVECNDIYNNRGVGIVGKSIKGVNLVSNALYENGMNVSFSDYSLLENTYTSCN